MRIILALGAALLLGCAAPARLSLTTTEAATALTQITHSDANERAPAVSPNGASLAYEVETTDGAPPHVEVLSLGSVGMTGPPNIEYRSGPTIGLEPTWMPDSSGLVFVTKRSDALFGLVQTIGSGVQSVAFTADAGNPIFSAQWPTVAPNGHTVAMALSNIRVVESGWRGRSTQRFNQAIAISDLAGTGVDVIGPGTEPSFSPNGKQLAFARMTGGHAHLFVANADGSDATQITEGPNDDQDPTWSPDGRFIAFCSAQRGEDQKAAKANLFAVQPDGGGLVQLTEGDRFTCRPDWGHDGFLYFHSDVTGLSHIWRVRPAGERFSTSLSSTGR